MKKTLSNLMLISFCSTMLTACPFWGSCADWNCSKLNPRWVKAVDTCETKNLTIVLQVLGEDFSVAEARKVFAKFLGIDFRDIDHSNFKKALLPFLTEVDERSMGIGRPAKFYKLSCYN